jgi:glycosyltransferase involved in cell wall biosynthesis
VFGIDDRAKRLDIDYVEVREKHSFDPGIWRALTKIVRDRGIHIVHSHDYKTDLLALLLARRLGVVALSTAHGWTGQSARERWVYYPIEKRLLARFPRVIAVSTDIKDELVRHGADAGRITVMLNSIDPSAFQRNPDRRDRLRQELGFSPNDVVIGAVGRLEQQKRFDLLIESFATLLAGHPNLRLAIVGDGSLRADLIAVAAKLGVSDRCRMLGHREDIADVHHAFDLFVQSSEYEGTPNAVLEAMAMETPLIATDVGGTRELAVHGVHGLIIPKHNAGALQAAVRTVIADPDAARLRKAAARLRVERELSFEARTRRLESIYEELIQQRRSVRASGWSAHA